MNVLEKILEEIDRLDDPYFVGYIDRYKVKEIIRSHMDDQNGDVTEKPSAAELIRAQGAAVKDGIRIGILEKNEGAIIMQKWEEIEQKKEYLKGYIKAKNRETLIKDQIQQLRLGMMLPALQGDGMPRGSSQKDLSDYTAKIESLMEELEKEWVESVIRYERIRKAINKMNDEQEKEALTRYYLLRENNKAIQRKMGVSKAKLYRIYDSALENFEIL